MKAFVKIPIYLAIAGAIYTAPTLQLNEVKTLVSQYQDVCTQLDTVKSKNATLETQLIGFSDKYKDIAVTTNYDIAKAVDNIDGCEISTIASLITRDGAPYTCSEVSNIDDVNFFSSQISQMKFYLKLTDVRKFLSGLNSSALSIDSFNLDEKSKTAVLVVNTVLF